MPKQNWIFSLNPLQSDVVNPGYLVTNRKNPQNYFDGRGEPGLKQTNPKLTRTELQNLAELHSICNNNTFKVNLTSFFSKQVGIGSKKIRHIEAARGESCQLVQSEEWLTKLCSARSTQAWLERNIGQLKRKVWMITGILTLTDAKVMSGDGHNHSFGGEFSAPVLSVAGVAIPTPLDPSIGASTARDSIHLNSVIVPGETVFAIHYSQVRLQKRRRKDIAASEDYALHSKATWTPLWEMRGAPRRDWAEDESDDDDDDDDYNEELEQPLGSEEVWVADLADEEESEEEDEEEVGEEDDGEDEEEREMNEKKLHGGTTHPKSSA